MLSEDKLMPFSISALPAGPWLVFAPHPDDEVFGMGGSLLLAQRLGLEVDIVFVTDGAQGGADDGVQLAQLREDEAQRACGHLGVRECFFWRQADRGLRVTEALLTRVAQRVRLSDPKTVFIPSCLELHPDHRATAMLVWSGLQRAAGFDGGVLAYDIGTQGPVNTLIDISAVLAEKRAVMEIYQSQVATNRYVDLVASLDHARTFTLPDDCRAAEGFYRMPFSRTMSFNAAMLRWLHGYLDTSHWQDPQLVSVIVRTRNRRQLLAVALSSVAAQSYPRIEIIVVNDGGEDVSDIVDDFRATLEAVKYTDLNPAQGRAAAANTGLEQVTGAYFMLLDDDDWLDVHHIANLVHAHQTNECVVAYTGVRTVNEDGSRMTSPTIFNFPFDRNRLYYENYIPIHAAMVSRSVIDSGFRFDPALEVFEDWDFWLQLLTISVSFQHVDAITGYYRVGPGHGIGDKGGYPEARRLIYSRWSKTWGVDEIDDLMTRLVTLSSKKSAEGT